MGAKIVYALCGATSLLCFWLLLARYWQTRIRLLLWSSITFLCFTAANLLLFVDKIIVPDIDLRLYRSFLTLAGVLVLLYTLVTDSGRSRR